MSEDILQPLSVIEMVPPYVAKVMQEMPEWVDLLSEEEIVQEASPDKTLWELRVRLWTLIDVTRINQSQGGDIERIAAEHMYKDICSRGMYQARMKIEAKAWFVCRPIHNFGHQLDALVTIGTARLWEILSLPIREEQKKGRGKKATKVTKINAANAKLVMQAFRLLKDTRYGGPVQQHLHAVNTPKPPEPEKIEPAQLDEEIKTLEARLEGGGDYVDVGRSEL